MKIHFFFIWTCLYNLSSIFTLPQIDILELHKGGNPIHGFVAIETALDATFHHLMNVYPNIMRNITRKAFQFHDKDVCVDSTAMIPLGEIMAYLEHLKGFPVILSSGLQCLQ